VAYDISGGNGVCCLVENMSFISMRFKCYHHIFDMSHIDIKSLILK